MDGIGALNVYSDSNRSRLNFGPFAVMAARSVKHDDDNGKPCRKFYDRYRIKQSMRAKTDSTFRNGTLRRTTVIETTTKTVENQ